MESREDQDNSDKTEEATDERRNQFREEGNIANPREIVGAAVLIIFTLFFSLNGANIVNSLKILFERAWIGISAKDLDEINLVSFLYYISKPALIQIGILFSISIIIPLLVGLLFTRFNFTLKKMELNFDKLNPISGIGRIFGFDSLTELVKVLVKFIGYSTIIYLILKSKIIHSSGLYFYNQISYLKEIGNSISQLFFSMCLAVVIIGIGDFAFNLWKIEKEMKMTKQELKEDIKKQEGDPQVKSKRKRMGREFIFQKSMKEVPKATFIVTNPEHFSVAVRYVKGMNAPIVVAKGQDLLAFKIREIAKKHDIMIVENKPLARTLYKTVKIGKEVPPSLYQAIIEVMKYIYRMRGKQYFEKSEKLASSFI